MQSIRCYGCMNQITEPGKECFCCGFNLNNYIQTRDVRSLPPGDVLNGRYVVGRMLGKGGFGITYIGYDLKLQIRIAIKEYYPSEFAIRNTAEDKEATKSVVAGSSHGYQIGLNRFLDEARKIAKFNTCSGIVSVTDFFYANNTGYIVMNYLPGESIAKLVKKSGKRYTEEEILYLFRPIFNALKQLHNAGIMHRDISPDNFVMNEQHMPVLIDFGAARSIHDQHYTILLKHGYAPVEQYSSNGKQGPWTDVYGLSATIYFMITGIKPERAINRIENDQLKNLKEMMPQVSQRFASTIEKGMKVKYDERIQSIDEMEHLLYIDEVVKQSKNNKTLPKRTNVSMILSAILIVLIITVVGVITARNLNQGKHIDASVDDKDAGFQTETEFQRLHRIEEAVLGTYVTGRNNNYGKLTIYDSTENPISCGMIPKAHYCEVLATKNVDGIEWSRINYFDRIGWIESSNLRYISDDDLCFELSDDFKKNLVYVNESVTKTYTEPMASSYIVDDNILYGTEFYVREVENGWGKIESNNKECWIDMSDANSYISDYWQIETGYGNTKKIKVREEKNEECEVLGHIPGGTVVKINDFSEGWGKVMYNGITGWIKLYYATPCNGNQIESDFIQ